MANRNNGGRVPGWIKTYAENFHKAGVYVAASSSRFAQELRSAGGHLLRVGISGLGLAFSSLISVTGLLTSVFRSSVDEAERWAQSMTTLRANNGLSSQQGYALAAQNSILGISPERTAQIYGDPSNSPYLMGARAGAMQLANPQANGGLARLAEAYQRMAARGPEGRITANAQLDVLYGGKAPDEIRNLVNMRPQMIRQQIAYGQSVQRSFGISPEMLRKYSEEIPMAMNRLGFAFSQARLKIAVLVAPFLERTLGAVANYIGKNAGKISEGIKTGVTWLIRTMPPALLRGGEFILRAAALILRGFAWLAQGIATNGALLLNIFNAFLNGFTGFVRNVLALGQRLGIPIGLQRLGQNFTGLNNNTPAQQIVNQVVGTYTIGVTAPAVGAVAGAIAQRVVAGGGAAATGGAGAGVGAGAGAAGISWWTRAGKAWKWVRNVPKWLRNTPKMGPITVGGLWRTLLSAPGAILGAGAALGVAGYEALRRTNLPGFGGNLSAFQILRYYVNRWGGASVEDAGLRAQGIDPDQFHAQMAARAAAAAGQNPGMGGQQPNIITTLAQPVANAAMSGSNDLWNMANTAHGWREQYERESLQLLRDIAQSSGRTVDELQRSGDASMGGRILDHIGAYIAQDAFRLARRRG